MELVTAEEAIEELKRDCERLCKEVYREKAFGIVHQNAYGLAITTLEMMISQKMTDRMEFEHVVEAKKFRDVSASCPRCGYRHEKGELWTKYCPWCGQSIDWSE